MKYKYLNGKIYWYISSVVLQGGAFSMTKGKLIVISGPSGTGKGEICKKLLKRSDNLALSVSMTTRMPRKHEKHGREYYFVSKEEFENEIKSNGLLEYADVFGIGNYYGTPKDIVLEQLELGKDIILEIDVEGGRQVKANYCDTLRIFIAPPNMAELQRRISGRGTEEEEIIKRRLEEAITEIDAIEEYDYLVINDKIDEAVKVVESILIAEKAKVTRESADCLKKLKEEI